MGKTRDRSSFFQSISQRIKRKNEKTGENERKTEFMGRIQKKCKKMIDKPVPPGVQ